MLVQEKLMAVEGYKMPIEYHTPKTNESNPESEQQFPGGFYGAVCMVGVIIIFCLYIYFHEDIQYVELTDNSIEEFPDW